jgi:hypothetical protein
MANFFENVDPETAAELDQLSRLLYELRGNLGAVLGAYGAADPAALLHQIESGAVSEHPAYEHYLSARILAETRETVRALLGERAKEANRT